MADPVFSVPPNPRVRFSTIHIDEHFLVLGKPAGVVTQPGKGHTRDALLNGVFATYGKQLQNLGKRRDFGLVHRLDRPTSGLVLVGRTAAGYDGLRAQFEARTIHKTYVTLVQGVPRPPKGVERGPIRTIRRGGLKMAAIGPGRGAKAAVTQYRTIGQSRTLALLECHPETGRLHQIRAHLAHRGWPVVGDRDYGHRNEIDAQFRRCAGKAVFLHAGALKLAHPVSGQIITISMPLPARLQTFLGEVSVACPRRWCE
jgi:23S rRNA pseudouridine1911/1915/1917 synthase